MNLTCVEIKKGDLSAEILLCLHHGHRRREKLLYCFFWKTPFCAFPKCPRGNCQHQQHSDPTQQRRNTYVPYGTVVVSLLVAVVGEGASWLLTLVGLVSSSTMTSLVSRFAVASSGVMRKMG